MNKFKFFSLLTILSLSISALASDRCQPGLPSAESLYEEDFPWKQTLEEIKTGAEALYVSPKRLSHPAYKNKKGETIIPLDVLGVIKDVKVSPLFIKSVTLHIEEGLKRQYVDAITFSDMGHSHFYVPQKFYDDVINPIPVDKFHKLYEALLSHKELKILYHTAEQLTMKTETGELVPDRHIQWRFFTRNLVGDNQGLGKLEFLHNKEHNHNTAADYDPGYRYWGAGYYVSANEKGCFPFVHKGKTYYFDLNLAGINPKKAVMD